MDYKGLPKTWKCAFCERENNIEEMELPKIMTARLSKEGYQELPVICKFCRSENILEVKRR